MGLPGGVGFVFKGFGLGRVEFVIRRSLSTGFAVGFGDFVCVVWRGVWVLSMILGW